jgi:hypothetical protein
MSMWDSVKVFSATVLRQRATLGEQVTEWLEANPKVEVIDSVVTQSSDAAYHCLTITVFYREQGEAR